MKQIEVAHDPELDPSFPKSWPARVKIRTTDGKNLENRVDYPKGDVENPLTWDELVTRFKGHCKEVFDQARQQGIVGIIQRMEELEEIERLTTLLRVKGGD